MSELKKDIIRQKGQNDATALNASFIFIGQKIEKLGNVLYLLTKSAPDQDPLKWQIRDKALGLMSFISSNASQGYAGYAFDYARERIATDVRVMLRLVSLAVNAGYLSDSHGRIIVAEFERVLETLAPDADGWVAKAVSASAGIPMLAGRAGGRDSRIESPSRPLSDRQSGTTAARRDTAGSSGRREQIVALMQAGREYSIKEVSQGVQGVSEKTIQRELLAMVEQGILAKKGERRWSTYSRL